MKFSGCYKSARSLIEENSKKSGATSWEHNQLTLTHKLYTSSENAEFPYYDCWVVLKDQPKWSVDFTTSLGAKCDKTNSKMFQSPRSWSCGGSHSSRSNFSTPDGAGRKSPDLHNPSLTFASSRISSSARHDPPNNRPKTESEESASSPFNEDSSSFGTPQSALGGVHPPGVLQALQSMNKQHQDQAQSSSFGSVKTPGFMQFFQSMVKQYQDQEADALRQQEQQQREAEQLKQEQQRQEAEKRQQEQQRQEAEALRRKQEQQRQEAEQQRQEAEFMQNCLALFQQQQMQGKHVFQGDENEGLNGQPPLNDHSSDHSDEDNADNSSAGNVNETHSGLIGDEGHALGAPKNLIGTKKAKAIRSLQVTQVPSAPRITIIETPTGRSQRTTGIPETDGKF